MPIIIDNLTVSYQKRPAIHHVKHTFKENESCAIFGPNGAGKSTLLKACMRLVQYNTGSVNWQNLQRKDIAYLPQQCELDRTQPMTVFELVAMGLWYEIGIFGGLNKTQKIRVSDILARVGMEKFANRTIAQLSNGQLQRVLFARMMVQDAQFLLLDEPFNAVDINTTSALLSILHDCQNQNKTVIAVLHDPEQVKEHFGQTLLFNKEVISFGETSKVLTPENIEKANQISRQNTDNPKTWCEVA